MARTGWPLIRKIFYARLTTLAQTKKDLPMAEAAGSTIRQLPVSLAWLPKLAPVFGIHGSQVRVLTHPEEFFNTIKKEINRAQRRVVLSSLYLGTGSREQELVDCLMESMRDSQLRVTVLLDYTRGSRGVKNSRTMLLPLLKHYPDRVQVYLYHTPDLRGIWKKITPERYNETIGLNHLKVYLCDDNLLISGANLSESYFTNRQDRYMMLYKCPKIADFFHRLVTSVGSFSFQLTSDDTTTLTQNCVHPFQDSDDGTRFKNHAREKLEPVIKPSDSLDCSAQSDDSDVDTWIVPLVQMGPFGITVDGKATQTIFQTASQNSRIKLASGYFNLTDHYMDVILSDSKANYDILTAAPRANGFYGASGVSGAIPDAYTYIAKQFLSEVNRKQQDKRIQVSEFDRSGWTFHAKGLWYYLPHQLLPIMTLVGSPNFGYRSVYRDLEAQIAVITENDCLRKQLHQEQSELYERSEEVTANSLNTAPDRKTPLWVTYVTQLIRKFF